MARMRIFKSALILLLLLPAVGASSNNVIISPGDALNGARAVIPFAEYHTTEDRRAYLQDAQQQGYTCWMFPNVHEAAVCIQVPPRKDSCPTESTRENVLAACQSNPAKTPRVFMSWVWYIAYGI